MTLNPYLTSYMITNLKWIIDLIIDYEAKTIKFAGENTGSLGLGKDFLNIMQKAQKTLPQIRKLGIKVNINNQN